VAMRDQRAAMRADHLGAGRIGGAHAVKNGYGAGYFKSPQGWRGSGGKPPGGGLFFFASSECKI
jgi:hypothetical protein